MKNKNNPKPRNLIKFKEKILEFFKDPPIITLIIVWLLFLVSF